MSKAKGVFLTIGVTLLVIGVVVGVLWGAFLSTNSSSVISYFNLQYQINLPEDAESLYSFERTGGFPSDGTVYHEFEFKEVETSFLDDFHAESNEEFEKSWNRYYEWIANSESTAAELLAHAPNFGGEYRWRLISRKTAGRTEFKGNFASDTERKDFYQGADLLFCVAVPVTNRLYVLEYTL